MEKIVIEARNGDRPRSALGTQRALVVSITPTCGRLNFRERLAS